MENGKEAAYLLDGTDYLHLREHSGGVGFALYDKESRTCLGTGIIAKEQLLDYGVNILAAARAHIFVEHLAEPPEKVRQVAISTLEPFRESGIRKRQLFDADSLPKDDMIMALAASTQIGRWPHGVCAMGSERCTNPAILNCQSRGSLPLRRLKIQARGGSMATYFNMYKSPAAGE